MVTRTMCGLCFRALLLRFAIVTDLDKYKVLASTYMFWIRETRDQS